MNLPEIINQLGFNSGHTFDIRGRLSIADLFPKSKSRCGIYLLKFSDETYYIGQANDVVRRFSQHRKRYENIINLWFQPIGKEYLNSTEQRLIQEAELSGILLTNKTFVSNIQGDTDLDLIISPQEQKNWVERKSQISDEGFDLFSTVETKHKIKYRQNFEKLRQTANFPQIKRILKTYITTCLPAFKKTEMSFWALSCLPSTNANSFPRLFCLNINAMEVFVLGYEKKTKQDFCFIVTTKSFLDNEINVDRLLDKYKTLEMFESKYRSAGIDQIVLNFSNLNEFEELLKAEDEVIASIKEINLRLMRKGGTIYSPYHCFDLANEVLA